MSRAEDPERLLAEALRAQAASAPVPRPPSAQEESAAGAGRRGDPSAAGGEVSEGGRMGDDAGEAPVSFGHGYGLISGSDGDGPPDPLVAGPPEASGGWSPHASGGYPPAEVVTGDDAGARTVEVAEPGGGAGRQLGAGWILALAVLLGLAAGAVAGLLTLL